MFTKNSKHSSLQGQPSHLCEFSKRPFPYKNKQSVSWSLQKATIFKLIAIGKGNLY